MMQFERGVVAPVRYKFAGNEEDVLDAASDQGVSG